MSLSFYHRNHFGEFEFTRIASNCKVRGTQVQVLWSAMVDLWLEVESQQYNPPISSIVYQYVILPIYGGVPDQNLIDANLENLGKVLDLYEYHLSKTKYLAGDFFSLADLNHLPYGR